MLLQGTVLTTMKTVASVVIKHSLQGLDDPSTVLRQDLSGAMG